MEMEFAVQKEIAYVELDLLRTGVLYAGKDGRDRRVLLLAPVRKTGLMAFATRPQRIPSL